MPSASASTAHCQPHPTGHERHRPEETVLHQVLSAHWAEFRERAEEAGGLPKFVTDEVEAYLRCGRPEYGLLLCRCRDCGHEKIVALSCKRRSCPSCAGRRMTDGALDLVERVLPLGVPVRQWVCSLPWQLRALCGYDSSLCADVCRIFTAEVSRSLRRRANKELGLSSRDDAHTGAVAFLQRFDSALRLNVHVHLLSLDGVYVLRDGDPDGDLAFHELSPPDAATVAEVARRTAEKLKKLLVQRGRYVDPELADAGANLACNESRDDPSALSACQAAAVAGTELFGERAGAPALRLVDPSKARPNEPVAIAFGINVHARVAVHGNDRARLERLCRYLGRPAIALERLSFLDDGRVRYEMKKTWKDGTEAIVLSPLDLVARFCALVPPPKFNLVRYFGVLAPGCPLRKRVVPKPPEPPLNPLLDSPHSFVDQLELGFDANSASSTAAGRRGSSDPSRPRPWAWLLKHVFRKDVSLCEWCGGPMKWVEHCTGQEAIALALHHQGLGPRPPPASRSPLGQLSFDFR